MLGTFANKPCNIVHQQKICPLARRACRAARCAPVSVMSPLQQRLSQTAADSTSVQQHRHQLTQQISEQSQALVPGGLTRDTLCALEEELRQGEAMAALRRFNDLLESLPEDKWEELLLPVMNEFAFNLESFNPAFTATLLKVQCSMGYSDYVQRDEALRNLIQPLAGEYGMHNGEPQGKTHRLLFSEFYQDILRRPLEQALAAQPRPAAAVLLFQQMMRDISGGGGHQAPVEQGSYALGYNLAIEYLADYEKTWMLDSFKALNARVLAPAGRGMTEWMFLEVHAEGEKEHAAIGHNAVLHFVPAEHEAILRKAMRQHDKDFAAFYNKMADMLEQL